MLTCRKNKIINAKKEENLMQKENIKLTKNHNNATIKVHILPEDEMRRLGFTDYANKNWYYCKPVFATKYSEITFNLSVNKTDTNDWRIDVLDENFCQPYDYQYFLAKSKNPPEAAVIVNKNVENIMQQLSEAGIISGHNYGDYI